MTKDDYQFIFDQFEMYFPTAAEKTIDWRPLNMFEIIADLNDDSRVLFNFVDKSIRTVRSVNFDPIDDEEIWKREFSFRLIHRLRINGITQNELAAMSDISAVTLSNYIRRKTTPRAHHIYKIAHALKCSTDELINF